MKIENSIKAIIVKDSKILLIKNYDKELGDWYALPGGRQEHGETMYDALKRECKEEINCEIAIKKLRFIREYIHNNHEFKDKFDASKDQHKIEFMFECELAEEQKPEAGIITDRSQTDIAWFNLDEIVNINIYPKKLKDIKILLSEDSNQYWGDTL